MENKVYNVAIVGCGKILPRHLEAIEENKNFSLTCVCDVDETKYKHIKVNKSEMNFKCAMVNKQAFYL